MRIITLPVILLAIIAGGGSAAALNCMDATLPSSIVICSDPDLTRLAYERQQIFNETWSRLKPEQRKTFLENQRAWVRSYATACGVPPDHPPPLPAPVSIIECFRRAAVARAAYLRTYGLSTNTITSLSRQSFMGKSLGAPPQPGVGGSAADEIALEQKGGIFVIPVQINGAITLPFVIDSGAADVQIPIDVFSTLIRANTILPDDLMGTRTYTLADGSTRKEPIFLVRKLKVGDQVLYNVPASVSLASGEILLGQSFLSKFAEWTLDNQRHVLKLIEKPATSSPHPSAEVTNRSQPNSITTIAMPVPPHLSQPQGHRFQGTGCGSILDNATQLEWYVGPDFNMTWAEANKWIDNLKVCNQTWTMPSIYQLRSLFDRHVVAGTGYFTRGHYWPAHIDPVFSRIGKGSWVWARGPSWGDKAPAFNFNQGIGVQISRRDFYGTVRVFAVRHAD